MSQPESMRPSEDTELLPEAAILLRRRAADWREAIRLAGDGLAAGGSAMTEYAEEMVRTVEELGPYIVVAPGFALAHARPSPAVLRTGLSWVSLAEPVEFGSERNDPVDLVVGLAALDHDAHLQIMSRLAAVLADEATLARLRSETDPEEIRRALGLDEGRRARARGVRSPGRLNLPPAHPGHPPRLHPKAGAQ